MGDVAFFVEVLDRRGAVRGRVAVEQLPATIGRAYHNAVIVDDPYVCPVHARVSRDAEGSLVLQDMNSVNGIYLEGGRDRVARAQLPSGTEIRIGHTHLRFVEPGTPVRPAVVERLRGTRLTAAARSRVVAAGTLLIACGIFVASQYLSSYDAVRGIELAGEAVTLAIFLALWAGVWSMVSRVVIHRFHFVPHYTLTLGVLIAVFIYAEASAYLRFLFDSPILIAALIAVAVGLVGFLLYGHLSFASPLQPRQKLAWSIGIAALAFGVGVLFEFSDRQEFDTYTEDPGALKPVAENLIPTQPVAEYIAGLGELKAQVDELAVRD